MRNGKLDQEAFTCVTLQREKKVAYAFLYVCNDIDPI